MARAKATIAVMGASTALQAHGDQRPTVVDAAGDGRTRGKGDQQPSSYPPPSK